MAEHHCAECGRQIQQGHIGGWTHTNLTAWAQMPHRAIPLELDLEADTSEEQHD